MAQVPVYGGSIPDTGWRRISVPPDFGDGIGDFLLRRIDSICYATLGNKPTFAGSEAQGVVALDIPLGFRPDVLSYGLWSAQINLTSRPVGIEPATNQIRLWGQTVPIGADLYFTAMTWTTTDLWPDELPGAAL